MSSLPASVTLLPFWLPRRAASLAAAAVRPLVGWLVVRLVGWLVVVAAGSMFPWLFGLERAAGSARPAPHPCAVRSGAATRYTRIGRF